MKNNLKKAALGVALISLFGIGCKKDSANPAPQQKTQAFTITSSTFKNGIVDHGLIKDSGLCLPSLAWQNQPNGTKGYWIIMDDDQKHVYWTQRAFEDEMSLNERTGVFPHLWFVIPERSQSSSDVAVIEVFALSCSVSEFEKHINGELSKQGKLITKLSRSELMELIKKHNFSNMILGSAKVSYQVKRESVKPAVTPGSVVSTVTEPIKSVTSTTTLVQEREPVAMSALEFREATARTAKFTSKRSLRKATFQCAKVIQGEEIDFDEVEYMTVGNVGTLLNLLPSTTYKVRTYTEEQGALKYSNEVIFTTAGE